MSLHRPRISGPSSLNLIGVRNKAASFGGEVDGFRIFESEKTPGKPKKYTHGKPSLTPWLADRDARDRATRAKLAEVYKGLGWLGKAEKVASCRTDFYTFSCPTHERWESVYYICGDRLCCYCQRASSVRLLPVVKELIGGMRWPLFCTLTISNLKYLEASDIDKIRDSFTRLRHRRSWRNHCAGALYRIEITHTRNPDGSWNLHLHFVGDIEFWESADLAREWLAILPREWQESIQQASARAKKPFDSIVKIRRVGPKHTPGDYSLDKVAEEMAKYFVKGMVDILALPDAVVELISAIKGKRLFGTVGCCRGKDKEIREALQAVDGKALDCPFCVAEGASGAESKMVWMGKSRAANVEQMEDGSWVPNERERYRLKVDFMSREFARPPRPDFLAPVERPPPFVPTNAVQVSLGCGPLGEPL